MHVTFAPPSSACVLVSISQQPKPVRFLHARSNRHHLQQTHKEPTPQPRSYWSTHSTHENIKPTCNQIRNKIIQTGRDVKPNPPECLSNTSVGVQASASQPPCPPLKNSSSFYSPFIEEMF